ncbi:MAG: GGDEF domain-containing protein [Firmicutes bacterium]|nr:GGDEF domain-containing protein [Bacillota bacterium]
MKNLSLAQWRSVPPALFFNEEHAYLNIQWPAYKEKPEYLDPLTGLPNRRAFDDASKTSVELANRQSEGFGIIVLDIDHFKKINDTHGHQAGDKALQIFAAVVDSTLREEDFFARIGGEEFIALTPAWDKVFGIGERVRKAVESQTFDIKEGVEIKLTCSFGCASYPDDAASFDKLFDLADKALYKAKNNGRNKGEQAK